MSYVTNQKAMDFVVKLSRLPAEVQSVFVEAILTCKGDDEIRAFIEARLPA